MVSKRIAIIRNGKIIYSDDNAIPMKPAETAARASREDGRMRHRKDILQRNQVDYWKANPDKLSELSPELRRQLS